MSSSTPNYESDKSNNNYNCVNVYTSIDGVRVLQASYEIPNTDSENNIENVDVHVIEDHELEEKNIETIENEEI